MRRFIHFKCDNNPDDFFLDVELVVAVRSRNAKSTDIYVSKGNQFTYFTVFGNAKDIMERIKDDKNI